MGGMNWPAVLAIYRFEMGRFWRTAGQSILAPVISTTLYFVVFGAVHGMSEVPKRKPRPLLFYRGEYTGIEPDKNTPATWRNDLEAFLTATTNDTWL